MRSTKICLMMVASSSILLMIFSCAEEEDITQTSEETQALKIESKPLPDLSDAIQKRVEKKPEEAVALLEKYNQDFPNSPKILIQLSRALVESEQYSLAAFRLDQAISVGGAKELLVECAEAYQLAGDLNSAQERYQQYLSDFPEDEKARLSLARVLAQNGLDTEALNAFEQSIKRANAKDCLLAGNLYLKKKIFRKAEQWFIESARLESPSTVDPLVGILQVKLSTGDENAAEELILAIEQSFPGSLSKLPQNKNLADLLKKRRLDEFGKRGILVQNLSVSELAQELLQQPEQDDPVVSSGPKLSSPLPPQEPLLPDEIVGTEEEPSDKPSERIPSLAEAFAPSGSELAQPSPLELGWSAYLAGNYATALMQSREAIKENGTDSEAWRLSSQSYFQLGQIREAEMTILEAIRHNPNDLQTRVDYLNIARDTLSSSRYLRELEKTHERFPQSGEILWQLARRYHLVERMPVTAGILYQKLLRLVPEGSALHTQAEMELIKIQNL